MREFGDAKASKTLYKKAKINGEIFEFYNKVLPAAAVKAAREWDQFIANLPRDEDGALDIEKFDETEYNARLIDLLPLLVPEHTAAEISERMEGRVAPIMSSAVAVSLGIWILNGMPEEAKTQVKESTGKAKPGQKK